MVAEAENYHRFNPGQKLKPETSTVLMPAKLETVSVTVSADLWVGGNCKY